MGLGSRPTRRLLLTTLGIGLVGGTLYNITLNEGTSMTSASSAALIMATAPVWGMLLAAGLGVEPLRATNVIGAVVSLVGVVIILGRGPEGGGSSPVANLVVFAASVSFAAYVVLSRAQHTHYPPLILAAYTIFLGGLAVSPFTPLELASWNWGSVSCGVDRCCLHGDLFHRFGVRNLAVGHRPHWCRPGLGLPVPDPAHPGPSRACGASRSAATSRFLPASRTPPSSSGRTTMCLPS